jgi:hypothetical protein
MAATAATARRNAMPHHAEGQQGMQQAGTTQQAGTAQRGATGQQNSPADNLTFDLISTLHTKLEGLEAYKKYMQDAQGDQECLQLFQQLQQNDQQQAQQIMQQLQKHLTKRGGSH